MSEALGNSMGGSGTVRILLPPTPQKDELATLLLSSRQAESSISLQEKGAEKQVGTYATSYSG